MLSAFMFPTYLATNKIQIYNTEREDTEGTIESREAWYQGRSTQGPNRPEREAKLTHGNLQISKCLYIIIRSCKIYKG